MANNGFDKISDALKKAAAEKEKLFRSGLEGYPEEEQAVSEGADISRPVLAGVDHKIVAYFHSKDPIVEQFRALRTHICLHEKTCDLKTIGITSASNREGKTLISVNLSIVLAQDLGKPALLVDCNLRRPSVNTLLGIPNDKGLNEILSGRIGLDEALVRTDIKNLSILTAGQLPESPAELLGSKKMADLLIQLKSKFSVIILDLPSVIHYADTRIVGPMVDGVAMVVRTGVTRREAVVRAEGILKSVGCNILGYVLTGIEYYIPEYIHRHL